MVGWGSRQRCVGLCKRGDDGWHCLPPILVADPGVGRAFGVWFTVSMCKPHHHRENKAAVGFEKNKLHQISFHF